MARKPDIAPKKLPRQSRALATIDALAEAATDVLAREGPGRFTANRVAEKAGVNIASFYQYFPNKEALLFHVVKLTWKRQTARLAPLLGRPGPDHAAKLRDFVREFFRIEEAEVDLRRALRAASVELSETKEFRALMVTGAELMRSFVAQAVGSSPPGDLDAMVRFTVLLITSVAERATDEGITGPELIEHADLLTDMLVAKFDIF